MKLKISLLTILCINSAIANENLTSTGLYLDLMKKCLINSIYRDPGLPLGGEYNEFRRENGQDWPVIAHTMIGLKRLNNLQFCVEDVLKNHVPGDLIETGVWRGGAVIFMRAILKAYGKVERSVWVADSFEGLPAPNTALYPADAGIALHQQKILAVSLEQVQENFKRYDLLDNQVHFLKGWFCDSLPTAPIEKLAILRLDGDLYQSTIEALTYLYPKLSVGGYVIIDDYFMDCCRRAVNDFRKANNIEDEMIQIDSASVFWKRSK